MAFPVKYKSGCHLTNEIYIGGVMMAGHRGSCGKFAEDHKSVSEMGNKRTERQRGFC